MIGTFTIKLECGIHIAWAKGSFELRDDTDAIHYPIHTTVETKIVPAIEKALIELKARRAHSPIPDHIHCWALPNPHRCTACCVCGQPVGAIAVG